MNRLTHPVPTVRKRAAHSSVDVLLSHDATWLVALSALGVERVVDLPAGELVPRIC